MKVYISLPISGHDIDQQKLLAKRIANALKEKGHEPINPFDSDKDGMTYGQYLGKDITMIIDHADAVIFAEGWLTSRGCNIERCCADICGKLVAYYPSFDFQSTRPQWAQAPYTSKTTRINPISLK